MTLKWPEMTFDFRIGKKKLGISEVVVGRPLFILNEIYSTEKTYVNNLNALVTVYQEPMQGMIFQNSNVGPPVVTIMWIPRFTTYSDWDFNKNLNVRGLVFESEDVYSLFKYLINLQSGSIVILRNTTLYHY